MSELEAIQQAPLVPNPVTGEVVPADSPPEKVAAALAEGFMLRDRLQEFTDWLQALLVEKVQEEGTGKTLHLDGWLVTLRGGEETFPDIDLLLDNLRAVGLPDHRVLALVRVKREINRTELRKVWNGKTAYAQAIAGAAGPPARLRASVSKVSTPAGGQGELHGQGDLGRKLLAGAETEGQE